MRISCHPFVSAEYVPVVATIGIPRSRRLGAAAEGWSESFAGKWLNDSAHAHQSLMAAGSDRLLHSRSRSLDCGLSTGQARTTALACCDKRTTPVGVAALRVGGASATCPKRRVEMNDVGRGRSATGRRMKWFTGSVSHSVTEVFQCTPRRSGSAVVGHR